MDVHGMMGDVRALRRIVTLLVALACLAEAVSRRSFPVRFIVLALLRRAEPVALHFVAAETGLLLPDLEECRAGRNSPADALLLAAQFRILAAALEAVISLACLFDGWNARANGAMRRATAGPRSFTRGGTAVQFNDTS